MGNFCDMRVGRVFESAENEIGCAYEMLHYAERLSPTWTGLPGAGRLRGRPFYLDGAAYVQAGAASWCLLSSSACDL